MTEENRPDSFELGLGLGWVGSIDACSNLLETGDPLEETPFAVTVHGTTYHLQDEAFFSYFARQSPSIGYQGRYSFLGTLTSFSPPCPTAGRRLGFIVATNR